MLKKSELLAENKRLKEELAQVCEHHKRAMEILNKKVDIIAKLKARLKSAEK